MTPTSHRATAAALNLAAATCGDRSEAALYRLLSQHHAAMANFPRDESDVRRLDALTDLAAEVRDDLQDEVEPEPAIDAFAQEAEFTRRNAFAIFGHS
jgi:hypothetical protein